MFGAIRNGEKNINLHTVKNCKNKSMKKFLKKKKIVIFFRGRGGDFPLYHT